MPWIKPAGYSAEEVNHAGDALISVSQDDEIVKAIEVLNNWRAIHSYPMHVFKVRLKHTAQLVDKNSLTVQRLKRVPAILKKLERDYPSRTKRIMLYEMQDIGGCRTILSNVSMVRKLYEKHYLKSDLKHTLVKVNDYISTPKKDGYRSFHIIYSYRSDKVGKKGYNGLLIELQLRSKLQHYWATAIETVDFFTRQAIKSSEGQDAWKEFFKLLSSAFAMMEGCPLVKGTPNDEKELYLQIKRKEAELNVIKKMEGWAKGFRTFRDVTKVDPKIRFFLLELNISREQLNLSGFTQKQEKEAIEAYSAAEKRNQGNTAFDVVLVGADTTSDLEKAYPNYFVDTTEFLNELKKVVGKYPDA